MFDVIFERFHGQVHDVAQWARLGGAVLGVGVAVKLMDDHLDADIDRSAGLTTLARRLGPGTLPYALSFLVIGTMLHVEASAALFLGAYAVGMAHEFGANMPTGLPGWMESALAFVIAGVGTGIPLALGAVSLMVFVQCVDDFVDVDEDRTVGAGNVVRDLGAVESYLLAGASLLIAVSLAPKLALAVFVAMAVLDAIFRGLARDTYEPVHQDASEGGDEFP